MPIVLKADYRIVCPVCRWGFSVTQRGLDALLEAHGRMPTHEKCKTQMVAEPIEISTEISTGNGHGSVEDPQS